MRSRLITASRTCLPAGAAAVAVAAALLAFRADSSPRASAPPAPTPGSGAAATGGGAKMTPASGWAEVERLVKEQKLEAAATAAGAIRVAAQLRGDEAQWTRALVRQTQLRIALGGYETAVRFLKEQAWPADPLDRCALDLFYAHALATYLDAYSWEIGTREKVEARGAVDLKAWTREQIFAEAQRAYAEVWAARERLGAAPVGRLGEYIDPNTYPPEVRGTLRDAVSYLFAELLADTSDWRPEQSSEVWALDLGALLGSAPGAGVALDDPAVHPLVKVCAILADLEAWHASRGERAAELEARLERARRLDAEFTSAEDRAQVRADLAARLPAFRTVGWWAEGMAQLAELTREDDAPDALVRARAIAREGLAAYPDTVGGRHCNAIVAAIEARDFRVQAMTADAPGRRSIEVTHANLTALWFHAYRVDLLARIAGARDYNLLPDGAEVEALVRSATPAASWRTELPPTPDYRPHRTFVTPPPLRRGMYVIAASAREDFAAGDNRLESVAMLVGDLVLVTRQDEGEIEARVVSGETGAPVAGATVDLYRYDWQRGH
ncbi:MAG TPA: hypothetical protein VLW17_09405, partial [Thermoanaerobaculaceae bacterium]|nr:hypothetical protein [Thermoanaerobaculaceae bacterium]